MGLPHRGLLALVPPLAALGIAGCFRDPDPIELDDRPVTVHAVIEAGADSAVVVISRTGREGLGGVVGVPDAEVRLSAGEEITWLVETPDDACVNLRFDDVRPAGSGIGCYRAAFPSPIRAGAVYALEIRLPDGVVITGETATPEPVDLTTPTADRRVAVTCPDPDHCYGEPKSSPPYNVPVATIPVGWQPPASVTRADIVLRPLTVYFRDRVYPGRACILGFLSADGGFGTGTARDTTDALIPNITCGGEEFPELRVARFDSIRAELSVIGWNDHYSRYMDGLQNQGVRVEAAAYGLTGAFGVFGAVSRATRAVLLIRDPPPAPVP